MSGSCGDTPSESVVAELGHLRMSVRRVSGCKGEIHRGEYDEDYQCDCHACKPATSDSGPTVADMT